MKIVELSEKPALLEAAIQYFWKNWGNESNSHFYSDCIQHSLNHKNTLPKFYIGVLDDQIICSYALLTNDIISRQDLMPWFACLYVNEAHRKKGIAEELLNHGLAQAKIMGYQKLYLSTDLFGFYEKKAWEHYGFGYGLFGDKFKIYAKST